jgi:hypothetical protein
MSDIPPPLRPEPPLLPLARVVSYATRNDALSLARVWQLDGAVLRINDVKGGEQVVRLSEVKDVRLEFAPTRPELNRFRCQLTLRNGERLEFFNRTYAGLYDFRDTSAEYVGFVQALMGALVRQAAGCRFLAGASGANYLLSVAATVGLILCFGLISFFLLASGLTWLIAVKLLILAFYLPTLVRWLKRNRPQSFAPAAIPGALLPAPVSMAEASSLTAGPGAAT